MPVSNLPGKKQRRASFVATEDIILASGGEVPRNASLTSEPSLYTTQSLSGLTAAKSELFASSTWDIPGDGDAAAAAGGNGAAAAASMPQPTSEGAGATGPLTPRQPGGAGAAARRTTVAPTASSSLKKASALDTAAPAGGLGAAAASAAAASWLYPIGTMGRIVETLLRDLLDSLEGQLSSLVSSSLADAIASMRSALTAKTPSMGLMGSATELPGGRPSDLTDLVLTLPEDSRATGGTPTSTLTMNLPSTPSSRSSPVNAAAGGHAAIFTVGRDVVASIEAAFAPFSALVTTAGLRVPETQKRRLLQHACTALVDMVKSEEHKAAQANNRVRRSEAEMNFMSQQLRRRETVAKSHREDLLKELASNSAQLCSAQTRLAKISEQATAMRRRAAAATTGRPSSSGAARRGGGTTPQLPSSSPSKSGGGVFDLTAADAEQLLQMTTGSLNIDFDAVVGAELKLMASRFDSEWDAALEAQQASPRGGGASTAGGFSGSGGGINNGHGGAEGSDDVDERVRLAVDSRIRELHVRHKAEVEGALNRGARRAEEGFKIDAAKLQARIRMLETQLQKADAQCDMLTARLRAVASSSAGASGGLTNSASSALFAPATSAAEFGGRPRSSTSVGPFLRRGSGAFPAGSAAAGGAAGPSSQPLIHGASLSSRLAFLKQQRREWHRALMCREMRIADFESQLREMAAASTTTSSIHRDGRGGIAVASTVGRTVGPLTTTTVPMAASSSAQNSAARYAQQAPPPITLAAAAGTRRTSLSPSVAASPQNSLTASSHAKAGGAPPLTPRQPGGPLSASTRPGGAARSGGPMGADGAVPSSPRAAAALRNRDDAMSRSVLGSSVSGLGSSWTPRHGSDSPHHAAGPSPLAAYSPPAGMSVIPTSDVQHFKAQIQALEAKMGSMGRQAASDAYDQQVASAHRDAETSRLNAALEDQRGISQALQDKIQALLAERNSVVPPYFVLVSHGRGVAGGENASNGNVGSSGSGFFDPSRPHQAYASPGTLALGGSSGGFSPSGGSARRGSHFTGSLEPGGGSHPADADDAASHRGASSRRHSLDHPHRGGPPGLADDSSGGGHGQGNTPRQDAVGAPGTTPSRDRATSIVRTPGRYPSGEMLPGASRGIINNSTSSLHHGGDRDRSGSVLLRAGSRYLSLSQRRGSQAGGGGGGLDVSSHTGEEAPRRVSGVVGSHGGRLLDGVAGHAAFVRNVGAVIDTLFAHMEALAAAAAGGAKTPRDDGSNSVTFMPGGSRRSPIGDESASGTDPNASAPHGLGARSFAELASSTYLLAQLRNPSVALSSLRQLFHRSIGDELSDTIAATGDQMDTITGSRGGDGTPGQHHDDLHPSGAEGSLSSASLGASAALLRPPSASKRPFTSPSRHPTTKPAPFPVWTRSLSMMSEAVVKREALANKLKEDRTKVCQLGGGGTADGASSSAVAAASGSAESALSSIVVDASSYAVTSRGPLAWTDLAELIARAQSTIGGIGPSAAVIASTALTSTAALNRNAAMGPHSTTAAPHSALAPLAMDFHLKSVAVQTDELTVLSLPMDVILASECFRRHRGPHDILVLLCRPFSQERGLCVASLLAAPVVYRADVAPSPEDTQPTAIGGNSRGGLLSENTAEALTEIIQISLRSILAAIKADGDRSEGVPSAATAAHAWLPKRPSPSRGGTAAASRRRGGGEQTSYAATSSTSLRRAAEEENGEGPPQAAAGGVVVATAMATAPLAFQHETAGCSQGGNAGKVGPAGWQYAAAASPPPRSGSRLTQMTAAGYYRSVGILSSS